MTFYKNRRNFQRSTSESGYYLLVREIHCGLCDNLQQFTLVYQPGDTGMLHCLTEEQVAAGWRIINGMISCPKHRRVAKK